MNVVDIGHGRGLLPENAARSLWRLDADIGRPVQVTEAGRTWERQLYLYNGWVKRLPGFNLALHPSNPLANHVLVAGRRGAIDSDEQTGIPWAEHGWRLENASEPWHRGYYPEHDRFISDERLVGELASSIERLAKVVGNTVERAENGDSLSQRLDRMLKIQEQTLGEVERISRILGSTEARAAKGDTIGARLDKLLRRK